MRILEALSPPSIRKDITLLLDVVNPKKFLQALPSLTAELQILLRRVHADSGSAEGTGLREAYSR